MGHLKTAYCLCGAPTVILDGAGLRLLHPNRVPPSGVIKKGEIEHGRYCGSCRCGRTIEFDDLHPDSKKEFGYKD